MVYILTFRPFDRVCFFVLNAYFLFYNLKSCAKYLPRKSRQRKKIIAKNIYLINVLVLCLFIWIPPNILNKMIVNRYGMNTVNKGCKEDLGVAYFLDNCLTILVQYVHSGKTNLWCIMSPQHRTNFVSLHPVTPNALYR